MIPQIYVTYGPHGHPGAEVFHVGFRPEKLKGKLYAFLEKWRIQGNVPTRFFDGSVLMAEQGYHVVRLVNGQLDAAVLAALPVPRIYQPQPDDMPGRKMHEHGRQVSRNWDESRVEVWTPGDEDCDHDFGLESFETVFRTEDGQTLGVDESYSSDSTGEYYDKVTCSRCGRVHAVKQDA